VRRGFGGSLRRAGILLVVLSLGGCKAIGLSPDQFGFVMPFGSAAPSAAPTAAPSPSPSPSAAPPSAFTDDLVARAQAEGALTTIGFGSGNCGFTQLTDGFQMRYGISVNVQQPGATTTQELDALKSGGAAGPDAVILGYGSAVQAATGDLLATYRVADWGQIPDNAKDAGGAWYGSYFGTISFEVNTKVVKHIPKSWSDLLKPEYKHLVALNASPLKSSVAAFAVWGAALANGGSVDDIRPGIAYFKQLAKVGNLLSVGVTPAELAAGKAGIRIDFTWDTVYAQSRSGGVLKAVIPTDGRIGDALRNAVSASAPHPWAARLWEEYLLADEGQNAYLSDLCTPIRLSSMIAAGTADTTALAAVPDVSDTHLPSPSQIGQAYDDLSAGWASTGITIP